mgnify:CR=1 FL=1
MATKKTNTTGTKTPVAEAVKTEAVKAAAEVKADATKAVKAVEKVAEKAVEKVKTDFDLVIHKFTSKLNYRYVGSTECHL